MQGLRDRARAIRAETYALYLACRDPRVPWYAKVLGGAVLAYALSPLDLIPDFIPVLGYLDDLIIIPLGLMLVRRLIPAAIMAEHRAAAGHAPVSRAGLVVVVGVWVASAALFAYGAYWLLG